MIADVLLAVTSEEPSFARGITVFAFATGGGIVATIVGIWLLDKIRKGPGSW